MNRVTDRVSSSNNSCHINDNPLKKRRDGFIPDDRLWVNYNKDFTFTIHIIIQETNDLTVSDYKTPRKIKGES